MPLARVSTFAPLMVPGFFSFLSKVTAPEVGSGVVVVSFLVRLVITTI